MCGTSSIRCGFPAAVVHLLPDVAFLPAAVTHLPAAVALLPAALNYLPAGAALLPAAVALLPADVTQLPESVALCFSGCGTSFGSGSPSSSSYMALLQAAVAHLLSAVALFSQWWPFF
jgi:hypothetical protein